MLKKLIQIFFGTENFDEMKKKGIITPISFSALFSFEIFILVPVTQAIVVYLLCWKFSAFEIFLMLWAGNLLFSACVMFFSDKSQTDPTLAEGLRRLFEVAIKKSIITGLIFGILISFFLIFWEGAAAYIIFLRGLISKKLLRVLVFIAASGVQMAIWTCVYVGFATGFWDLIFKFF